MLISIHIPKTAGTPLRKALDEVFSRAELVVDNGDQISNPTSLFQTDPARWRRAADEFIAALPPKTRVVHGHFSGAKYLPLRPQAQFIAWVRHPVARLISHYFYYKQYPGDRPPHQVHLAVQAGISFAEFAALPTLRNFMSSLFLRGLCYEDLAFVGVQERYTADLAALVRQFGWPAVANKPVEVNRNPYPGYREQAEAIRRDQALLRKIEQWHADDMALFERAISASQTRRAA